MENDNEDDLKNKENLHIAGRHTALDIFRFAVFLKYGAWLDLDFNRSLIGTRESYSYEY